MHKQIGTALLGLILFISYTSCILDESHNHQEELNTSEFAQQMLDAHNTRRKLHCASPLELDDELTKQAQAYAEEIALSGEMVHSKSDVGENIFNSESSEALNISGDEPVTNWYSEIKDYSFGNGRFSKKTGHFTQVVWKGSKQLGVGIGYTPDRKKVYVVAQYMPAGNMKNRFEKNVSPAGC